MNQDRTRREFLLELARGAAYTAPAVTTFAVAPALMQGKSSQHKGKTGSAGERPEPPPVERPSDKYRPPDGPPSRR